MVGGEWFSPSRTRLTPSIESNHASLGCMARGAAFDLQCRPFSVNASAVWRVIGTIVKHFLYHTTLVCHITISHLYGPSHATPPYRPDFSRQRWQKGWFARNSPPGQHTSSPDTVMRLCVKTFSLTCQGSGESERGNAGPSSLQTSSGFPPDCLTPKTHIHTTWAPACADGISRKVWSSTTSLAVLLCVWVLALRPSTFVSQQVWVRFNSLRFGLLNICALLASSLNSKTLISTFFSFRRA